MWKKVNKGNMGKQEIEPSFPGQPSDPAVGFGNHHATGSNGKLEKEHENENKNEIIVVSSGDSHPLPGRLDQGSNDVF